MPPAYVHDLTVPPKKELLQPLYGTSLTETVVVPYDAGSTGQPPLSKQSAPHCSSRDENVRALLRQHDVAPVPQLRSTGQVSKKIKEAEKC
jgi:hypothetical protein